MKLKELAGRLNKMGKTEINLPKEWLSSTQINMFLRCPRQYMYRYIDGIKIPPAGILILGGAGHSAIAYNYKQKIKSHQDLKTSEVLDFFAEEFDRKVEEENPVFEDDKPGTVKDNGTRVLKEYQKVKSITIQPKEVEKEFAIEFANVNYFIKGFIDLITDKDELVDHKISKKSPNQKDIDDNHQMTCYKIGYNAIFGKDPIELRFDYLVTSKTPKIKSYPTFRSNEDIEEYLELIGQVVEYIKRGDFYKSTQGYQCSEKWCGYYGMCRPHKINKIYDLMMGVSNGN